MPIAQEILDKPDMKNRIVLVLTVALVGLALCACDVRAPEPSSTPEPSTTPLPTETFMPVPTDTPEPTDTPTPEPTANLPLSLGEVQVMPDGGFSFRSIIGFETNTNRLDNGDFVGIYNKNGTILISVLASATYRGNESPEEIMDDFLSKTAASDGGEIQQKGEIYPIIVDGVEGAAFDLTGTMFDSPMEGQIVLIMPSESQILLGFAVADLTEDKDKWINEGSCVFSTLLGTVEFIEDAELGESACPVSSDNTYGYSPDNPIRVGGAQFEGPEHEEAYLDSLSGPKGEIVDYVRIQSLTNGNSTLDVFQVSYSGAASPVFLYLDKYSYGELKAPVGFICWKPIPLNINEDQPAA